LVTLAIKLFAMDLNFEGMLQLLAEQAASIDAIQVIVLVFGVTEVLLARANNILLYPAGIIATTLSVYSLYGAALYAESLLNVYYVVMSVYGWWYWSRRKNDSPIRISYSTRQEWLVTTGIVFGGWFVLYFLLKYFTSSTVPVWDAWVSSTAWAGMWLLAKRKVENWILLNISNAFAIPLLFEKELPLFAILTIFLFLVACKGYMDWVKSFKTQREIELSKPV
jgi:nicotinamide mononucleotide transporter